jgi:hypothetical protein
LAALRDYERTRYAGVALSRERIVAHLQVLKALRSAKDRPSASAPVVKAEK